MTTHRSSAQPSLPYAEETYTPTLLDQVIAAHPYTPVLDTVLVGIEQDQQDMEILEDIATGGYPNLSFEIEDRIADLYRRLDEQDRKLKLGTSIGLCSCGLVTLNPCERVL